MTVATPSQHFAVTQVIFAFLLAQASQPVLADPLIEYWAESFGSGPTGPSYGELRQEFFAKVQDAEAAVNACGGCADAQAELDSLREEERQFQSMAARALTMTGQPPAAFRLFGIDPPSFADYGASFPSTYASGEGRVNTNPEWLQDAPEFCQAPVRAYLQNLKSYQDRVQTSEIDFLRRPGGQYYEASRVYRACFLKDYAEFARLAELQTARAEGRILAEIEPIGAWNKRERGTIYYGDVPDNFMPPMPPAEVVKQSFAESGYRAVRFVTNKQQNDRLISTFVQPYSGAWLENRFDGTCSLPYAERSARAKRYCDDQNEIFRFEPYLLRCNYSAAGNDGIQARRYAFFWYDERVEFAKPDYLLPRDHDHPLLYFPGARTSCPENWQQVESEQAEWRASLDEQRSRIDQIPLTETLPRSEWLMELIEASNRAAEHQRERMNVTKAYDVPGYYTFEYRQAEGAESADGRDADRTSRPPTSRPGVPTIDWGNPPVSGDCIIAAYPGNALPVFPVVCWTDSRVSMGSSVNENGFTINMAFMPPNQFLLDEQQADTLVSDVRGAAITLRRLRDLVPMGELPIGESYLLQLAFAGENLRALCSFDYDGGTQTYYRLNCIDDQGRHLQSGTSPAASYPSALMVQLNWLRYFPDWQAKFGERSSGVMLGGMAIEDLVAIKDPVPAGDAQDDARLLLFADVGMTGSLQRIKTGDRTPDDDAANVTGHWVGDYQCGKTRNMQAELYLQDGGKGHFRNVDGTFVFRDTRFEDERVLSYAVAGQYLSSVGSLQLEPGEWIKTVPQVGYASFGLRATAFLTEDSARIQGDVTDQSCADIQLVRVSRDVPESIAFETQSTVLPSEAISDPAADTDLPAASAASTTGTATSTSEAPAGLVVDLPADSFMVGTHVPITVSGLPGNSADWVAISKKGQADNQYVSYQYTGGATEGTWTLASGPPGAYEVRVYLNWPTGGYNPVLRQPITVVSTEEASESGLVNLPKVSLTSRTFTQGQPIEVTVTGFPGNSQDWVAISKVGDANNSYEDYDYTYGVHEGTWTYVMSEPGDYEIRVYLNWPTGGYNPVVREQIRVDAQQ